MSEPSNIRINPFVGDGGTTTYINLTETHIIPSVSPYVIRLNEVPEKQDPSNIRAVWVDSATGAATASALTEVATTPAAGEFRPDYSTKADGNEAWNTGLIEFSAVDAGKIVQISYTGMGTLAAVQSNKYPSWYTDRGDGSDGDFIPDADCTIGGVKNYKSVFIKEGITVTVDKMCYIKCNTFINFGIVTANGADGIEGEKGDYQGKNGTTGGGVGGAAGSGTAGGSINSEVVDMFLPTFGFGGEGGTHGASGKAGGGKPILIVAGSIINSGSITANGGTGLDARRAKKFNGGYAEYTGSGGGGGGTISLIADIIVNNGTVSANGGSGGKPLGSIKGGADGENGTVIIKQLGAL